MKESLLILSDSLNFGNGLSSYLTRNTTDYSVKTLLFSDVNTDKISVIDPKIILFEIRFPEMKGVETIKQLKENFSETQYLAILSNSDHIAILELINLGVTGVVSDTDNLDCLLIALEKLNTQNAYFGSEITGQLNADYLKQEHEPLSTKLTPDESSLLKEIASGVSSIESCDNYNLSSEEYNAKRESILAKTRCNSNSGLALYTIMTLGVKNQ